MGVGALYKNIGRVRIWGDSPLGPHPSPKMWRWATTLRKSAQAVLFISIFDWIYATKLKDQVLRWLWMILRLINNEPFTTSSSNGAGDDVQSTAEEKFHEVNSCLTTVFSGPSIVNLSMIVRAPYVTAVLNPFNCQKQSVLQRLWRFSESH